MQINQHISNSCYQQNNTSHKSQNFTSRKAIIRELGDIVRITRREFPMTSNTYIERYLTQRAPVVWKVDKYADGLVGEIRGHSMCTPEENMRVIRSLNSMKELKVGNCSEYAQATYVACKLNGVKDVKFLSLFAYNPDTKKIRELDHAVVGVNFNEPVPVDVGGTRTDVFMKTKKGIVLDSWSGYTDYERNATKHYESSSVFGKIDPDEVMCYRESGVTTALGRDDYLFLKHKYPKLIKKQKFSLKDALRWWVMDKKQYEFEPLGVHIKESYRLNSELKGAMTREQLTEWVTRNARESEILAKQKRRKEADDRHDPIKQFQNKLKIFGRKIFK